MAVQRSRPSVLENHVMFIPSPWLCRSPAQGTKCQVELSDPMERMRGMLLLDRLIGMSRNLSHHDYPYIEII